MEGQSNPEAGPPARRAYGSERCVEPGAISRRNAAKSRVPIRQSPQKTLRFRPLAIPRKTSPSPPEFSSFAPLAFRLYQILSRPRQNSGTPFAHATHHFLPNFHAAATKFGNTIYLRNAPISPEFPRGRATFWGNHHSVVLSPAQTGCFMHVMEYRPGGPIRPDIIRPTGVNPVGKMEIPLWFFHFSRSAGPSSFPKGTWTQRIFHPVKCAG